MSAQSPRTRTLAVDHSYLRTLGLDVIQGRAFAVTAADAAGIVVNTRFAALFFPGKDPLGRRVLVGPPAGVPATPPESTTVIGVVASAREDSSTPAEPAAYLRLDSAAMGNAMVIVRASDDAARLAPVVRDAVRRLDPGVALNRVMTLADVTWNSRWNPRVSAGIVISLSLIALALATIGLAALTAYAVAERSRELGIRLAIGATGASVVMLILKRVARQAVVGVAIGSALAKAWDPTVAAYTVAAASAVVVAVVLATSAWPAARAAPDQSADDAARAVTFDRRRASVPEDLERVNPVVAKEAGNAPQRRAVRWPARLRAPMSAVSQPNCRAPRRPFSSPRSLPQMNMVGLPPHRRVHHPRLPTELKALTRCASGNARCSRSMSDSSGR